MGVLLTVFYVDGEILSSVGLISKILVLNVSVNRQDVIVFIKQSDSIADVSIQRGQASFDPSTSSSQSSRMSQMSCFRADQSIAPRLLSTCLMLGENQCAKRLTLSHCCRGRFLPLTNIELSFKFALHVHQHWTVKSSAINVLRKTLLILVELQLKE